MAKVSERIEDVILEMESLNDDEKLYLIFNLHKDRIRQMDVHLYYALLGWKDAHLKELLKSKTVEDVVNADKQCGCPDGMEYVTLTPEQKRKVWG